MDLKEILHRVAKEEQDAIKELYSGYGKAFYHTAFAVLNDEKEATFAATEAFRRIINNAYRFDEALNAEYWLFDVLYNILINSILSKNITGKRSDENEKKYIEGIHEEAVVAVAKAIDYFSDLNANEIAAILRVRKSAISTAIKENSQADSGCVFDESDCPDYCESIASGEETGYENFSEKERVLTQKGEKKQRNSRFNKRLVSILLVIVFICIVIIGIVKLAGGNYGSDVNHNLLGEDILTQTNNKMPCTQVGSYVYFCGEDNKLYRRDIYGDKNECISNDCPQELTNDGEYVYYRNLKDGCMYRIDLNGKNKTKLCDVLGTTMTLYNDRLYFSATGGIYSIPSSGGKFEEAELVLDTSTDDNLYCVDMGVDSSGNIFFASGIGKGVHQITEYNSKPTVSGIFTEEVYNICIDNDILYFDCKDITGKILLYSFDIKAHLNNDSGKRILPSVVSNSKGENIYLSTGAFYVFEGEIYFATKKGQENILCKLDENRNQIEVTGIPSDNGNLEITEILVSKDAVYCFCSDGKKKGERVFFLYNRENGKNVTIF